MRSTRARGVFHSPAARLEFDFVFRRDSLSVHRRVEDDRSARHSHAQAARAPARAEAPQQRPTPAPTFPTPGSGSPPQSVPTAPGREPGPVRPPRAVPPPRGAPPARLAGLVAASCPGSAVGAPRGARSSGVAPHTSSSWPRSPPPVSCGGSWDPLTEPHVGALRRDRAHLKRILSSWFRFLITELLHCIWERHRITPWLSRMPPIGTVCARNANF